MTDILTYERNKSAGVTKNDDDSIVFKCTHMHNNVPSSKQGVFVDTAKSLELLEGLTDD